MWRLTDWVTDRLARELHQLEYWWVNRPYSQEDRYHFWRWETVVSQISSFTWQRSNTCTCRSDIPTVNSPPLHLVFKSLFGPPARTIMLRALSTGRVVTSIGQTVTTYPTDTSGIRSRVSISAVHMTLLLLVGRPVWLTPVTTRQVYRWVQQQ